MEQFSLNLSHVFGRHTDEFKVAVDNWMDGAVDGFSSTGADWSYNIVNSCGGRVPETSLKLSSVPELLGAESDEKKDFASYKVVKFEDTSPPASAPTVTAQQANCNLAISILYKNTVVSSTTTLLCCCSMRRMEIVC
jgi:hypothetical protein